MRNTTTQMHQWNAESQSGKNLHFEKCKGGYFSNKEEYGLKVVGDTYQEGTPTPDNPILIQCVKAGSKVICGDCEVTLPCDLYENDIWYPMSGKVVRNTQYIDKIQAARLISSDKTRTRFYISQKDEVTVKMNSIPYSNKLADGHNKNIPYINVGGNRSVSLYVFNSITGIEVEDTNNVKLQKVNDWLNANPTCLLITRETPIIEQYAPQPISMPQGTVNITQAPIDLSATMSATVLTRR